MLNVSDRHQEIKSDKKLPLIEATNIKKYFPVNKGKGLFNRTKSHVKAVDDVSIEIYPGETLGLVGESGCGKSTLGRVLLRLQELTEGKVIFNGIDVMALKPKSLRDLRREIQIVFQNPLGSLNPRFTIGK